MIINILNTTYDYLSLLDLNSIKNIHILGSLYEKGLYDVKKYRTYRSSFFFIDQSTKLLLPFNGKIFGYDLIGNINIYLYNKFITYYKIESAPIFNYNNNFTFKFFFYQKDFYLSKENYLFLNKSVPDFSNNSKLSNLNLINNIDSNINVPVHKNDEGTVLNLNITSSSDDDANVKNPTNFHNVTIPLQTIIKENNYESSSSNNYSNLNNDNKLKDLSFPFFKDLQLNEKFKIDFISCFLKNGEKYKLPIELEVDYEFLKIDLVPHFKFFDIKNFFLENDLINSNPLIFILLQLNNNDINSDFIFKFCSLIYQKNRNIDLAFFIKLFYEPNINDLNIFNEDGINMLLTWRELFKESITDIEISCYEEYFEKNNKEFLLENFENNFSIYEPNKTIKFLENFENNNENSDFDKNLYNRFFLLHTFESLLLILDDTEPNNIYLDAWEAKKKNIV